MLQLLLLSDHLCVWDHSSKQGKLWDREERDKILKNSSEHLALICTVILLNLKAKKQTERWEISSWEHSSKSTTS